jgi:ribosomal protein S21
MKHRQSNGQKTSRARITFDMLPKGVQRADRYKQVQVMYRMLKKLVNTSGLKREIDEHEYYVKPGEKKRKARLLAKAIARGEIKEKEVDTKEKDIEQRGYEEYSY